MMEVPFIHGDLSTCVTSYVREKCLTPLEELFRKAKEILAVLFALAASYLSLSPYRILEIDAEHLTPQMQEQLKAFERQFDYPYGSQKFRIVHGKEKPYGQFFQEMGPTRFYLAIDKKTEEIAAVGCRVLRNIPLAKNPLQTVPCWYLCDLKVGENHRGKHLPLLLFSRGIPGFFQTPRGYVVCMNPSDGKDPDFVRIWKKNELLPQVSSRQLHFYTFFHGEIASQAKKMKELFGNKPFHYFSNAGMKDFEIFNPDDPSQFRSWDLLHIQHGPFRKGLEKPGVQKQSIADYEHMVCAIQGSPLDLKLSAIKQPSTTATVLSKGMEKVDWNFLLTNEI